MNNKCGRISVGLPDCLRQALATAGFALTSILAVNPVQAIELNLMDGDVTGSVDTTISYGAMWRVQSHKDKLDDTNLNDGNRNFDTGLVSQVFKATSELGLEYENYGVFVRGTAFYDTELFKHSDYSDKFGYQPSQALKDKGRNNRFLDEAQDISGRDAKLLDAYLYGSWDIADKPLDVRVGRQVLNWGESLYYIGGLNGANPINAASFSIPGAEVREALIPVETLSFSLGLTDNLSMDAYYQWKFEKNQLSPVGTYFSSTDLFSDGANTAFYDAESDANLQAAIAGYRTIASTPTHPLNALFNQAGGFNEGSLSTTLGDQANFLKVADIRSDIDASDSGQWGVSFRYIAEALNDTEFAVYFLNHHNKMPLLVSGVSEDFADGLNMSVLAGALGYDASNPATWAALESAGGLATVDVAGQVYAKRFYAEDIRALGLTFSTTVGDTSFAGELAYRPNLPIAIAATDDSLSDLLQQASDLADNSGFSNGALGLAYNGCITLGTQELCRDGEQRNFERVEAFNLSLSAIHNFGPMQIVGLDSLIGLVEVASEHLRGSSLTYTSFDGNERKYVSSQDCAYVYSRCSDDKQISRNSWGYTAAFQGTFNDVYAGIDVSPFIRWSEDVKGNGHLTSGFYEGTSAYTVGASATYLNSLTASLSYTEYKDTSETSSDRDNISFVTKYSF